MSESTNTVLMLPTPATNLEAPMAEAETRIAKITRKLRENTKTASNYSSKLNQYGVDTKGLAKSWEGSVVGFAKKSVAAAQKQAGGESKLRAVLKSRTNATANQIKAITKLTSEQQANGVINDEIQMTGAEQLATYVNNADTIKNLIPALNNLTVAQKGFGATSRDAKKVADLMGEGLNGQTDELEKAGLAMNDYQKKVLKSKDSTMEQKATVLTQVIQENVGDANKEAAQSDSGKIQNATNGFQNLQEQVGGSLLPVLAKVSGCLTWLFNIIAKHPKIATFVISAITALVTLLTVLGTFSQIMMAATAIQQVFGLTFTASMLPIFGFAALIAVVIAAIVLLAVNWDKVTAAVSRFFNKHQKLKKAINSIKAVIIGMVKKILPIVNAVSGLFEKIFGKKKDKKDSKSKKSNKKEKKQKISPYDVPYKEGTTPSLNSNEKNQNKLKRLKSIKEKRTNVSYGKNALAYIDDEKKNNSKLNNNSEATGKINKITENKTVTFGNIYITAKGVTSDEVIKELVPKLKLQLANVTQTA